MRRLSKPHYRDIQPTPHNYKQMKGLRAKRDALELLWKQGLGGKALIKEHTSLMDKTLSSSFENFNCRAELSCPSCSLTIFATFLRNFTIISFGTYSPPGKLSAATIICAVVNRIKRTKRAFLTIFCLLNRIFLLTPSRQGLWILYSVGFNIRSSGTKAIRTR